MYLCSLISVISYAMRKKHNPNQGGQSNPRGNEPEPSIHQKGNYTHHLFDISYPKGLMEYAEKPSPSQEPTDIEMPNLPDSLFTTLPDFLQKVVPKSSSKEERDILLLGALGVLSACLSNIHGIYDGMTVYPNLYLFFTTQTSAVENQLSLCKQLVSPIHDHLQEQTKDLQQLFAKEMKEYKRSKGEDSSFEKPVPPTEKLLLIPSNYNGMAMSRQLADNDGVGLIFETEGDFLFKAIKTGYGNYTNILKKGFHHEFISYYRLTRREYREIKSPRLSMVLSGTINQLTSLIPSTDDGLFSRFIFYFMNARTEWKDVFPPDCDHQLDGDFDELGQEFLTFYTELNKHPDMTFHLTAEQADRFHYYFSLLQDRNIVHQDRGLIATIRRLGLIAFRMSMIFTALRIIETGDFSQQKKCLDVDFQASISIVRVLVRHASLVYSKFPDQ